MAYETIRVLIIDDNPVIIKLYDKFLSANHYQVITAANGNEGLQKAFQENPDVILVDIMLPDMSGYELCTRLRQAPRTLYIPIMFLTALDQPQARQKAIQAGGDDFITKTESLNSVEGRIKMLVKGYLLAHTRSWLADLPGGIILENTLRHKLASGQPFTVVFLDIVGLSELNERYGFEIGEKVLWQLARSLSQEVNTQKGGDLIGYYGQDDFLVITNPDDAKDLAAGIRKNFETAVFGLTATELDQAQVPKLAIGVVDIQDGRRIPLAQLNHVGKSLLKKAKTAPGTPTAHMILAL